MKVLTYESSSVFKRPKVVKRLKFLTNGGWARHCNGSAMHEDIEAQRDGWIFIAWDNGKIVGWAYMTRRKDHNMQIGVYVSAQHRKQGIGSRLLKRAKLLANEMDCEVYSHGWNRAGLKFYQKNSIAFTPCWEY